MGSEHKAGKRVLGGEAVAKSASRVCFPSRLQTGPCFCALFSAGFAMLVVLQKYAIVFDTLIDTLIILDSLIDI